MKNQKLSLRVAGLDNNSSEIDNTINPFNFRDLNVLADSYCPISELPEPGSEEEDVLFKHLYSKLKPIWQALSSETPFSETVVVVPSMTLDAEEMLKINGIEYYEERLLFLLIQLCNPNTEVVYVTSQPLRQSIVDYYLQLLPGIPYSHARRRLHMYDVNDASRDVSLTQKVLDRPALMQRIRNHAKHSQIAHLSVFNVTPAEKSLSVALGLPLMGADPSFLPYGTKSGSRKLFKQTGVLCPFGFEDLANEDDIAEAIVELYFQKPETKRAVVKINEGFSGEGNAIYKFGDLLNIEPTLSNRAKAIALVKSDLPRSLKMQAPHLPYADFMKKYIQMGGIVEEFLEGCEKSSPSVQTRITPTGQVQIISTHDQIMGGEDKQIFVGCKFPAPLEFHKDIHEGGLKVGQALADLGLVERVSIDYMAVPTIPHLPVSSDNPWKLYAIEINMRKGGTTHPFRTLQFLTGGHYNTETGLFTTPRNSVKYYVASDNWICDNYRRLLPEDLIDIITYSQLHFNSTTNTGVIFHMIGAVSQYGKFGITCIGNTPEEAQHFYDETLKIVQEVCLTTRWLVR
ncbi:carboxylate-amine ligase [bacterium]|nr:carboxylate-amine ligase [bacterium]